MRVRRLAAGELTGAEKERTQQHVDGCERCAATQREIAAEQEALRRDAPFPAFAAGVAEKLAQRPLRSAQPRWQALAIAAALALVAGVLVLRPADTDSVRSKGAAGAQLFAQDARGVHELQGPVAAGARLQLTLRPAGRKYAAAVLVEPQESSVIYSGPAVNGPLPQAFEWTGSGTATLKIVFADKPVDPANPPRDADVIEIALRR
jgi:hypothetical protein